MGVYRRAFSLLEMLMVVAALALIGAVAIPPLTRSLALARPEFAQQALQSGAQQAAVIATRTGRTIHVTAARSSAGAGDDQWSLVWSAVPNDPPPDAPPAAQQDITRRPDRAPIASLPAGWSLEPAGSDSTPVILSGLVDGAPDGPPVALSVRDEALPGVRLPLFSIAPDATGTAATDAATLVARVGRRYAIGIDPITLRVSLSAILEALTSESIDADAELEFTGDLASEAPRAPERAP